MYKHPVGHSCHYQPFLYSKSTNYSPPTQVREIVDLGYERQLVVFAKG